MKIVLNMSEYMVMKSIDRQAEADIDSVLETKLVTINVFDDKGLVEVEVDEGYVQEFLNAVDEGFGVILPLVKGIAASLRMVYSKLERIAKKHINIQKEKGKKE